MDSDIISSLIQAGGTVAAALIAAFIGKKFLRQESLKKDLATAQKDIEFLLQVETAHCAKHSERDGTSSKNTIRDQVRKDGYQWSGKFTPGRVKNP